MYVILGISEKLPCVFNNCKLWNPQTKGISWDYLVKCCTFNILFYKCKRNFKLECYQDINKEKKIQRR